MSVGGDIVSEVIALLQPIHDTYGINVREYGGELDDKDKDQFSLAKHLYTAGEPEEEYPTSVVLVEYAGVENKPQDTSHIVYLNTYRSNVWLISGYEYNTENKQGGDPLVHGTGLEVYDGVLDLMVGRKLLEGAERLKLEKSSRVYYGDDGGGEPFTDENLCALVYKLEFSFQAQSVWAEPPYVEPGHWYNAAGSVEEKSGFQAELDVPINPYVVDFAERAEQPLPVERVHWRSSFPDVPMPTALFPCADEGPNELVDVVDGVVLPRAAGSPAALHRRIAAGFHAMNWLGMVQFSPARALEYVESSKFEATDGLTLDPLDGDEPESIAGFLVMRLRKLEGPLRILMAKQSGTTPPEPPGWGLVVTENEGIAIAVYNGDPASPTITVAPINRDHVACGWFPVFFFVRLEGGGAELHVETPLGVSTNTVTAIASLSNTNAKFQLAGEGLQVALAAYWQTDIFTLDELIRPNRLQLWRGLVHPLDAKAPFGLDLRRNAVVGAVVHQALGTGDVVGKFGGVPAAQNPMLVPQDPYRLCGRVRGLPHDGERENLLVNSEDFSAWTDGPPGPTATGPDGMYSAFELSEGDTISQSGAAEGDYTFSVWARSRSGGEIELAIGSVAEMFSLDSRWARVWTTSSPGAPFDVHIGARGADDSTLEIWGSQLEIGTQPSLYIPTFDDTLTAQFTRCHVDWGVVPGPTGDGGKVQATLLPGANLLTQDGPFHAFHVWKDEENHLLVTGMVDSTAQPTITWQVSGAVRSSALSGLESSAVRLQEGISLVVAVRWFREAVELWVDSEVVARSSAVTPATFDGPPVTCYLMRDESGTEAEKWIGACENIRWWR